MRLGPPAGRTKDYAEIPIQAHEAARYHEGEQLVSATRPAARRTNIAAAQGILHSVDAKERFAWVSKALCRTTDPDELFVRGAAQRKAAVICRHCPVMQECGAEALDNKVEFGVWGGMTERQRRALLKQHPEVVSWADFFDTRRTRTP
jgi:WhiB family transcriptional regulator, redox-sensing transcriptional regulator